MESKKPPRQRFAGLTLLQVLAGLLFFLTLVLIAGCHYCCVTLYVNIGDVIYTLTSPLNGTGSDIPLQAARSCLPLILTGTYAYIMLAVVLRRRLREAAAAQDAPLQRRRRRTALAVTLLFLCNLPVAYFYADKTMGLGSYLRSLFDTTTLYEDYYVDPDTVELSCEGTPKNLLLVYLESMETTYASTEAGGALAHNYIPHLTRLAQENLSFSNSDKLGGFYCLPGATQTIGALMATTGGIPFAFPLRDTRSMERYENFASGCTFLGDLLSARGFTLSYVCGSDAAWGGYNHYFEQHGNYHILDFYAIRERGYVPPDYYVWWGVEDRYVFEAAQDELTALSNAGEPFALLMATMDTHYPSGYVCGLCDESLTDPTAAAIDCTDRQVDAFLRWCQEQPFYENTVIVVLGDHLRMDTNLVGHIDARERTMYNCILHSRREAQGDTSFRNYTAEDMFPTILSAMGYEIPGNRLGLGTDLFSGQNTLLEELGYDTLSAELSKRSPYYSANFS